MTRAPVVVGLMVAVLLSPTAAGAASRDSVDRLPGNVYECYTAARDAGYKKKSRVVLCSQAERRERRDRTEYNFGSKYNDNFNDRGIRRRFQRNY